MATKIGQSFLTARPQLVADALRATDAIPGMQSRSASTLVTPGFGASPTRIQANTKGMAWNAVKDAIAGVSGVVGMQAERNAREQQQAALEEAMASPDGMTPETMLRLRQLGVDADTLKLVAPKDNELGMNQIAQYGQTSAGMRTLNQLKPGTFSEDYIAQAEARENAEAARKSDEQIRVAQASRAPAAPHSRSEIDVILGGNPDEIKALQDYKMLVGGKGVYDANGNVIPKPAATGKTGRNAPVDPKAEVARLERNLSELESMLTDPSSGEQLFSNKQAIVIPAGEAAGKGDNPSVTGTLTAQYARTKKSPMSTQLERWGQEQALGRIKELYPASNSDIAMLLSMQPRPGDSRDSMERYLALSKQVTKNLRDGVYGAPLQPADTAAEDVWGGVPVDERPPGWEKYPADVAQEWMDSQ
jgi:hypothetical protein